jgi:hypothetical protein
MGSLRTSHSAQPFLLHSRVVCIRPRKDVHSGYRILNNWVSPFCSRRCMFHNMCHMVLPASRSSIQPQPKKEISSAIILFCCCWGRVYRCCCQLLWERYFLQVFLSCGSFLLSSSQRYSNSIIAVGSLNFFLVPIIIGLTFS